MDETSDEPDEASPDEVGDHGHDHDENDDDNHNNVQITTQRSQRTRVVPTRLQDCEVIGDNEVTTYVDTINHKESLKKKEWKDAMIEELNYIERNNT